MSPKIMDLKNKSRLRRSSTTSSNDEGSSTFSLSDNNNNNSKCCSPQETASKLPSKCNGNDNTNNDYYYFGYGPLVHPLVRLRRNIQLAAGTRPQPAILEHHRLTFVFGGVASVVPATGYQVHGVLLQLKDEKNWQRLVASEGGFHFQRRRVQIYPPQQRNAITEAYSGDTTTANIKTTTTSTHHNIHAIHTTPENGMDQEDLSVLPNFDDPDYHLNHSNDNNTDNDNTNNSENSVWARLSIMDSMDATTIPLDDLPYERLPQERYLSLIATGLSEYGIDPDYVADQIMGVCFTPSRKPDEYLQFPNLYLNQSSSRQHRRWWWSPRTPQSRKSRSPQARSPGRRKSGWKFGGSITTATVDDEQDHTDRVPHQAAAEEDKRQGDEPTTTCTTENHPKSSSSSAVVEHPPPPPPPSVAPMTPQPRPPQRLAKITLGCWERLCRKYCCNIAKTTNDLFFVVGHRVIWIRDPPADGHPGAGWIRQNAHGHCCTWAQVAAGGLTYYLHQTHVDPTTRFCVTLADVGPDTHAWAENLLVTSMAQGLRAGAVWELVERRRRTRKEDVSADPVGTTTTATSIHHHHQQQHVEPDEPPDQDVDCDDDYCHDEDRAWQSLREYARTHP